MLPGDAANSLVDVGGMAGLLDTLLLSLGELPDMAVHGVLSRTS